MSHLCAILLTGYIVPRICTKMAAIFCDVTETEFKKPESCQALSKARLKKASSLTSSSLTSSSLTSSVCFLSISLACGTVDFTGKTN